MTVTPPRDAITGLVLAGGQARRMSGADKGLVELAGRPMIEHVLAALVPQVGRVLISANRDLARYSAYGHRVVTDTLEGYQGPLAGLLSGLEAADSEFLLVVPCDAPLLAPDLAACLYRALTDAHADLAVAHDGSRQQPVFLLLRRTLRADLADFLAGGGRKVEQWFSRHRLAEADLGHRPESFVNVNDPQELRDVEAMFLSGRGGA